MSHQRTENSPKSLPPAAPLNPTVPKLSAPNKEVFSQDVVNPEPVSLTSNSSNFSANLKPDLKVVPEADPHHKAKANSFSNSDPKDKSKVDLKADQEEDSQAQDFNNSNKPLVNKDFPHNTFNNSNLEGFHKAALILKELILKAPPKDLRVKVSPNSLQEEFLKAQAKLAPVNTKTVDLEGLQDLQFRMEDFHTTSVHSVAKEDFQVEPKASQFKQVIHKELNNSLQGFPEVRKGSVVVPQEVEDLREHKELQVLSHLFQGLEVGPWAKQALPRALPAVVQMVGRSSKKILANLV